MSLYETIKEEVFNAYLNVCDFYLDVKLAFKEKVDPTGVIMDSEGRYDENLRTRETDLEDLVE